MLIEISDLHHDYARGENRIPVLKGVDLQVGTGDSLAIMGSSGAGKSTLLYTLGCVLQPSAGTYLFKGTDVSTLDDNELAGLRSQSIGFVFQLFHLLPELNVSQNVALPFLYKREMRGEMARRVEKAIDRVGLSHRVNHRPSELSGGEMQRVAIARAIAGEPELILADEPTGNLDTDSSADILRIFDEMHRDGYTIVIVTHDAHVSSACQRRVLLKDGRLIHE